MMAFVAAPPSVLQISPSRGEICKKRVRRANWASAAGRSTVEVGGTELHRISPLEGEMPGRAEGGAQASALMHHPAAIRQHPHYTTPVET